MRQQASSALAIIEKAPFQRFALADEKQSFDCLPSHPILRMWSGEKSMFNNKLRAGSYGLALAFIAALNLMAAAADARVGGGGSFGSRGSRTYSNPPATNTAPRVAPVEKSFAQPGKPTTAQAPASGASHLGASRFGGWRSLLLGGLFAGVLASIFGFGALASVLGFLLQVLVVAAVAWLVVSYFRNRWARPAVAAASVGGSRPPSGMAAFRVAGGTGTPALDIGQQDYDAFERLLGEVQLAYGRGDERALGDRATPEMLSYFMDQLSADRRAGLRNEISTPKLLQGDLAEAWREGADEYAAVAMRFSLIDVKADASGRIISGSPTIPQEVTEVWTFRRPLGGTADQWELSAIQQAGDQQRPPKQFASGLA